MLGSGIRKAIEDKIRYGKKLIILKHGVVELYQMLFKEITGLSIGLIYIERHLDKFSNLSLNEIMGETVIEGELRPQRKSSIDRQGFLKTGDKISGLKGIDKHTKISIAMKDKLLNSLDKIFSKRKIEEVKKTAAELKYPPMNVYEKLLS